MTSILDSVKQLLGISLEITSFDPDLIMHINATLATLTQMGIGPEEGLFISDNETTWDELVPNEARWEMVKIYVGQKVRLMFDPPQSQSVVQAMNQVVSEMEFRLSIEVEADKNKGDKTDG